MRTTEMNDRKNVATKRPLAVLSSAIAPGLMAGVLLASMLATGCGGEVIDLITPTPDTSASEGTTGESLYRFHCSACHGIDGTPLVSSTEDLRRYDSSYAAFDSVLSIGPGIMPRYPELDSTKRRRIYDHIRTFAP